MTKHQAEHQAEKKPRKGRKKPAAAELIESKPVETVADSFEIQELRQITRRDRRVDQIVRWLAQGAAAADISDAVAAAWPDEKVESLELDAVAKLVEAGQVEPDIVRGFITLGLREIYARCFAVSDYAGAMAALKSLAQLHGQL